MQSRTFNLTKIAPIAVALSLALVGPSSAQDNAPQLISASPLDVVAGSLPMSMFQTEEQTDSKALEQTTAEAVGTEQTSQTQVEEQESVASVYSPTHLQIATPKESAPAETQKVVTPEERATDKVQLASATTAPTTAPTTEKIESTSGEAATAPVSESWNSDLTPVTMEDNSYSNVQLRGATPNAVPENGTDSAAQLGPSEIAQSAPTDTLGGSDTRDFDLTPVSLPRRTPEFNRMDGFKYNMLYALPGRMFFSAVVDNSLRAETNVFQTKNRNRTDMIYRVLPNVTLGYALTRSTRVSANYFFLRDQYTKYQQLDRNFHSVGFQVDQDLYNKNRWTATLGFMGRALFTTPDQFSDQFFNDLLPSLTVTRQVGYSGVLYGAVLGQIRFREMLSQFQEGDQFYSFGGVYRKRRWNFLGDFTLNNNFGNSNLRQGENNQVIILTEEIAYRLPKIKLPVDAYVRCQQIFNMGASNSPGYAGVNTRVFGGIRASIAKPALFPVKLAEK